MPEFLKDVYHNHWQGLFTLALSITGSREQAEDAVQEAFAKMVGREEPLEGDPVPYVFRAVRNAAIDTQRARRRDRQLSESLFNGYGPPPQDADPHIHVLTKECNQILRKAVENLPEGEREAIVLKAFAGLTFEQAGEAAGISAKTIATRYRRGLEKLETRLRGRI